MKKTRVLIIEDSPVVRELLLHIINGDPRLEVAAAAGSAEQGLQLLDAVSPDVVSLDIRLPGMNGFEATRQIMSRKPTPIVVVSASVESEELKITMNALRAGALTVVEKPVGTTHRDYQVLAEHLCTQLVIMSQVKVVRQRQLPVDRNGGAASEPPPHLHPPHSGPFQMVGIVCSTGGPSALERLLNALTPDFPLPLLLVQHIPASFLDGFAAWLRTVCPFSVVSLLHRQIPTPGNLYLAPADHHLRLDRAGLSADRAEPVCGQRPSGTVLFRSMASSLGPEAIGVLLTGMGEDGAAGLLELRQAGGYTIAESEATAIVYGMPAAAVRLGAACESLPLDEIAPRIRAVAASARRS